MHSLCVKNCTLSLPKTKGQCGAGKSCITHLLIHLSEPQLLSTTVFRKKCLPVIQQQLFFFPIEIVPGSSRQANMCIPVSEKSGSLQCSGRHEAENTQAWTEQVQANATLTYWGKRS